MIKLFLSLLVAALISVVAIAHYWREDFADAPTYRTLPVTRGDLFIGVTATGTVEPVQIVDVGAQIIGSVKSFGPDLDKPGYTIDYGSCVKAGTVLAQLDDLPHRTELEKARAHLLLAEAELRNYRARLKQKELAFKRAKQLRGTDSEAEYEKAEAEFDTADADMAMGEAKLEQAKIAKTQAENSLAYTVINSPIDGVVIDRRVNIGQTVVAGMNAPSLFLLAKDLSRMLVWAAVNEADIGEIHTGQNVTFTVDAYPSRTFSGTVNQIRLNASLQQNVVTYGVIVNVDNTDGKLLPYMTAKLQFEVARRDHALLVPNQALRWQPTWKQISPTARRDINPTQLTASRQEDSEEESGEDVEPKINLGSPTLWVVAEDGLVRPVSIKVGLSDGMTTEILGEALKPNDAVVTGIVRKSERDFVSSFVVKVTNLKK